MESELCAARKGLEPQVSAGNRQGHREERGHQEVAGRKERTAFPQ